MNSHYACKLIIKGLVQGVGFRPHCASLAKKCRLFGEVYNDSTGVVIKLQAKEELKKQELDHKINDFLSELKATLPPLASITSVEKEWIKTKFKDFSIVKSKLSLKTAPILSDFALCKDCEQEFYDPKNPRYLYPFITCTNCGPRFSIIKSLPYDRTNTSMSAHPLCKNCANEYADPTNRRFHAQPISCPLCEIKLFAKDAFGQVLAQGKAALKQAANALKAGKIIAFKGVGGFHLLAPICAAPLLRQLKHRKSKPFVLLCKDLKMAKKLCFINEYEAKNLQDIKRPIVLCEALSAKKSLNSKTFEFFSYDDAAKMGDKSLNLNLSFLNTKKIQSLIAPHSKHLGLMLPSSPLHLALFEYIDEPLIATSANLKGESIIACEEDLLAKLGGSFELFVDYDREIINSSDDSLIACVGDALCILRSSRGFAPLFLDASSLTKEAKDALALGAELKNAFVIYHQGLLIISPFIGDLKSLDITKRLLKSVDFFRQTYDLDFAYILGDKHPHFTYPFKLTKTIPHHYAHFCALLFESNSFVSLKNRPTPPKSLNSSFSPATTKNLSLKKFENFRPITSKPKSLNLNSSFPSGGVVPKPKFLTSDLILKDAFLNYKAKEKGYLCFAFDGQGYGEDGSIWGGEVLYGSLKEYARLAHFDYFPLINPDLKNSGFMGLSAIFSYALQDEAKEFLKGFKNLDNIYKVYKSSRLKTSSLGRVFDAAAAIIFNLKSLDYEGQAGMLCEKYYDPDLDFSYKLKINKGKICFKSIIIGACKDEKVKACSGLINSIANLIEFYKNELSPNEDVFLVGGVFQNTTLLKVLLKKGVGFKTHQLLPANDGAIALGQMAHFLYKRR